jgi:two-component system, NtrC family, nitrogen regulation sensor histidine kinase GlnL
MLHERTIAEKFDRQLTHRSAARSVTGLARCWPTRSRIRSRASAAPPSFSRARLRGRGPRAGAADPRRDRPDRRLVDRMEVFSDRARRPRAGQHPRVLDRVKQIAENGFARHVRFAEDYDPSLPPVWQPRPADPGLPQSGEERRRGDRRLGTDGEIVLSTAFRPVCACRCPGNRSGRACRSRSACATTAPACRGRGRLFDPFVTTKPSGTGARACAGRQDRRRSWRVIECDSPPAAPRSAFSCRSIQRTAPQASDRPRDQ